MGFKPHMGQGAQRIRAWILLASLGFSFGLFSLPLPASDRWILVDTEALTLTVMEGEKPVASFGEISLGRNGITREKIRGDSRTPLGAYQVSEVRDSSRYHRFIAIDYPRIEDARKAVKSGLIDGPTFQSILHAHEQGLQPPAGTPLGGNLGIHGVGSGDPRVHAEYNWTDGCIALTDDQIDELTPLIRQGMTVVIIGATQ